MNQFKHANWWRSYLGELSKDFGHLQAWISSGNTSTSNGNNISQREAIHLPKEPISQGEFHLAKFSQGDFPYGAKFGHFAPWRNHLAKFRKVDLGILRNLDLSSSPLLRNAFEIPCFETLLMIFHCRFSKIFCLTFSFVNTYFTLVINQGKGCFCNSSYNLAFYCL